MTLETGLNEGLPERKVTTVPVCVPVSRFYDHREVNGGEFRAQVHDPDHLHGGLSWHELVEGSLTPTNKHLLNQTNLSGQFD